MTTESILDDAHAADSEQAGTGHRPFGRRVAAAGTAGLLASAATTAALVSGMGVAGAATFSVTNCEDSGSGSLRQAITDAEGTAGPDTITITATCTAANPVLVGSQMDIINDPVSIVGPGASQFVLDGQSSTRILLVDSNADVTISGVTFQNASATGDGGAVLVEDAGIAVIDGVVFTGNTATEDGGGLYLGDSDDVTITNSTFSNNSAYNGGGLYLLYNGNTVISNCTFVDNVASNDGGAISIYEQQGSVMVANSTITGNQSGARGGAMFIPGLYSSGNFFFNTITDNTAVTYGGLYIAGQSYELEFVGNIISGNEATTAPLDSQVAVGDGWTVTSSDNDFFGSVQGFTPDASDLNVDPMLEALADNGGPTQTRALMASSPVLNLGPVTVPTFPGNEFDQRGTPYVREFGGRSDMGAYEAQPQPEPTPPEPDPVTPSFTG